MKTMHNGSGQRLIRWITLGMALLIALPLAADWKQAVAYYQQGQFDKCIQELKPDLDKNPDWEAGHRLAGLCYLNLKNNALAIVELGRAVQLQSKDYATFRGLALAYFNSDKLDSCLQTLNQGEPLAKQPADLYDLRHMRGAVYYRQQKYAEAADDLAAAIRIKSSDWVDFSQLGIAYFNLNRFDDAIQMLQKALAIKPGETGTVGVLAKTYFKQGVIALSNKQYDQAIDFLRKAGTYDPSDGYVFYNLGEANVFSNNYPEAEKAYNQASNLMPRNADIYQRLGFLYEKQKKLDQAMTAYQKAIDLNPTPLIKSDLYHRMGMICESQKKSDPAIAAYLKALDLNPPSEMKADTYHRLGILYEDQQKWEPALNAYKKANEIAPSATLKDSIARVTEQVKK